MVKRARSEEDDEGRQQPKRQQQRHPSSIDRLSSLSDELLLRILSNLPVSTLTLCQRYVLKSRLGGPC